MLRARYMAGFEARAESDEQVCKALKRSISERVKFRMSSAGDHTGTFGPCFRNCVQLVFAKEVSELNMEHKKCSAFELLLANYMTKLGLN